MSFEGYFQRLCKNGHYDTIDIYGFDNPEEESCLICGEPFVWSNLVNLTNGIDLETGKGYGYINLEINKPAIYEECPHCENKKIVSAETYKIPDTN